MARIFAAFLLLVAVLPVRVAAQEYEVTRRSYTFLDNTLTIRVLAEAPGELHVIRGERGRIEVAARSDDGFPGFGLGSSGARELRLTAPGAERVRYLVVVPERVRVSVLLPGDLHSRSVSGSGELSWGSSDGADALDDIQPTTASGLYVAIDRTFAPRSVNVPDLTAVRSVSVRVEGSSFRVAASRPLTVSGAGPAVEMRIAGDPTDVVVSIPEGTSSFELRSGGTRLVGVTAGVPRTGCRRVTVQNPTSHQAWLTVYPEKGRVECR